VYLFVKYLQLLIVYSRLSSLGGDIDDDANVTFVLVLKIMVLSRPVRAQRIISAHQGHNVAIDVFGAELIDGGSLLRV
jgi:hypothetical protein